MIKEIRFNNEKACVVNHGKMTSNEKQLKSDHIFNYEQSVYHMTFFYQKYPEF